MHLHIIGIGGTLMSGIARLAKETGHEVTGCDQAIYPPVSIELEKLGIKVVEGFDENQKQLQPDLYVVGNVATRGMGIIEYLLNEQIPFVSGPEWLEKNVLKYKQILAVSGTHGKTTTASMLAFILQEAGKRPSWLIGGVPENLAVSSHYEENSPYFVIEADEYDTAFFDKRSKFVHYHPDTLIINNLEYDHADIFANLSAVQWQFHQLLRIVRQKGQIIYRANDPAIEQLLDMGVWTPTLPFASTEGFHIKSQNQGNQGFSIFEANKEITFVQWSLFGKYNENNALSALLAARRAGVDLAEGARILSRFKNVKRRMERKGEIGGITVYDDFAHHPTAITSAIAALKSTLKPTQRLIAIVEPRSNTLKMGCLKNAFISSLGEADKVFVYTGDVHWDLKESLNSLGKKTQSFKNFNGLLKAILQEAKSGDVLLVMSNGSFQGIHSLLLQALEKKHVRK